MSEKNFSFKPLKSFQSRARRGALSLLAVALAGALAACPEPRDEENGNLRRELTIGADASPTPSAEIPVPRLVRSYPLNSAEELIERKQIQFDREVSFDGRGSVRVEVGEPTTIGLFETGPVDAQDARLEYRARVRIDNLQGLAILEMHVVINGREDLLSRKVVEPTGNPEEWVEVVAPFELKKGEYPDNVKLALVVTGPARLWVDDLELTAVPHAAA